jgi:hypothetical protein
LVEITWSVVSVDQVENREEDRNGKNYINEKKKVKKKN